MKKFYPKLFFLIIPALATAQLHVKANSAAISNSYVFNKGEIIFVQKEIGLEGTSNIESDISKVGGNLYLRDDGQLFQGDSISSNTGTGVVSVYQINTRNAWDYHYWTSPVSDPTLTPASGNNNFFLDENGGGGIHESDPSNTLLGDPATFSGALDGIASPLQISTRWLHKFVATTGYYGWQRISNSNKLEPGQGFSMKGVNPGDLNPTSVVPFDFRGRPNSGNIKVSVLKDKATLVGNPYPSAMDLNYYLLYNAGLDVSTCGANPLSKKTSGGFIDPIAYFWQSDPSVESHYLRDYHGGYGTYAPINCSSLGEYNPPTYSKYDGNGNVINPDTGGRGEEIERRFSAIGQGFFVKGMANGTTVAKNEFRIFKQQNQGESNFRKPKTGKTPKTKEYTLLPGGQEFDENGFLILPRFTLETTINDLYIRTLKGVMYEEATINADLAMDGPNLSVLKSDVNFILNDKAYLINTFPYSEDAALPLQFVGEKETNTFSIKVTDVNFNTLGIWIHDKENDTYHNIVRKPFEFELAKGTFKDKYEIVFKDRSANLSVETEEIRQSFNVYQDNRLAQVHVLNPLNEDLKEVAVYDITGKQVAGKLNEGNASRVTISSANWSDGVYIVRLMTRSNVEFSKKITVFNKN